MAAPPSTINQCILTAIRDYADQPCFEIKSRGRYSGVPYRDFETRTLRMVRYLQSHGVSQGERVALVAHNSGEWMATCLAGLLAGGVVVPLRPSLAAPRLLNILQDCEASVALLDEEDHVSYLSAHASDLPHLKAIMVTLSKLASPPWIIPAKSIFAEALPLPDEIEELKAYAAGTPPEALALISYVPNEDGEQRGALFEQGQLAFTLNSMASWFTFEQDDLAFTIMPWTETASLLVGLHCFISGVPNALIESVETIPDDLKATSPTLMLDIPYTYSKFYEAFTDWLTDQPEVNQKVVQWAIAKGKEYRQAGANASPELRQEHLRADMTFFSWYRGRIGGRFRKFYVTGGAPAPEVAEFFKVIGIPLLSVYSTIEAGGFPAVSFPQAQRPGAAGRVAPGYELRLADDHELLVRGPGVTRGYWRHPEETTCLFDEAGWLRCGDTALIDADGFLHIIDRKRQVMVLNIGRKIMPAVIEQALVANEFIAQAAVFAEGKPYVSAMIVPDFERLKQHFRVDNASMPTADTPEVKALIDAAIGEVNRQLDRFEQIQEYSLINRPLTRDAGEAGPINPISRHRVAEQYAAEIEAMYPATFKLEAEATAEVAIEPERLRELLEKERILDAWMEDAGIGFLFDLARERQIHAPSMVHICDAAVTIAQVETEERPLSTAIIVGDPARVARVLPESQIQLLSQDHISRMRNTLVTMARMVDGHVLGYLIDKHGYVRGIHRLTVSVDEPVNLLLGPQFRRHASISWLCDALVFFVPAGGRQVRVFADGHLVGRYSNGDWLPEDMQQVDAILVELATRRCYDLGLIQRVLRCAFQMSERNQGAIFIIGDAEKIINSSDESEISHFAMILSANMANMSDQELINFAKQDGATVIDIQGKFRGCMVLLRPNAETKAEIGPGKGARHSSAAKMSAEADCVAITVSHDGPITIYESGKRILSL